ncbi:origin recognition complex subunit 2-domain-containing protein [Phaeosphaeriaceae sp. PMI808]|nr:origin recognition complex subunit 2-domain-containing protein [Phaeosphaeriaceae sp. PMI808]
MVSTKRRHNDDETDEEFHEPHEHDTSDAQTPSKRARVQHLTAEIGTPRSILKKKSGLFDGINATTPRSNRKLVFETPTKSDKHPSPNVTPTIVRNADRSARRKSNRRLLERTLNAVGSDEEALDEEDDLAEHILDDEEDGGPVESLPVPDTPSKRGRGRPKGSGKVGRPRKQRSPTPPTHLPPHEEYFHQNRPGGSKTSNNTLSAQTLLNHDEYFGAMQSFHHRHEPEMQFLLELHNRAFNQWIFELEEGFNICLYGYGSKRTITDKFIQRLYTYLSEQEPYRGTKRTPKIVVINGYNAGINIKDILTIIASTCVPINTKIPNQPASLLDFILEHLAHDPPTHPISVILNSIDSQYLRKAPTPSMLARLASHPAINLICTADTPSFPLLWDLGLKTQFKFLFHDTTTFAPYDAEIDSVESVNELLGRSGRRVGGRDGIGFVLRSLPENARSLFRILVMEQLALSFGETGGDHFLSNEHDLAPASNTKKSKNVIPESSQGVEYRVLYHKAVGEFVCSSEVGFRTLLKEFHDHQMIESRKDAMGTERLWVPFRQDELEALAEDLAVDGM